jgi:hypothetical protein
MNSDLHLGSRFTGVRRGSLPHHDIFLINDLPEIHAEALIWHQESGWVSWQSSKDSSSVQLCWLSLERRGSAFAWHDTTAVIGAQNGAVTILDFAGVIGMLKGLELPQFT